MEQKLFIWGGESLMCLMDCWRKFALFRKFCFRKENLNHILGQKKTKKWSLCKTSIIQGMPPYMNHIHIFCYWSWQELFSPQKWENPGSALNVKKLHAKLCRLKNLLRNKSIVARKQHVLKIKKMKKIQEILSHRSITKITKKSDCIDFPAFSMHLLVSCFVPVEQVLSDDCELGTVKVAPTS